MRQSRTACGMRPAFRRGWEGEGKLNRHPWRGPADAQRPPHGGDYSALGTRGQSPWRSHTIKRKEAVSRPLPRCGITTAPLHKTTPAGRPAPGPVGQRASGKESGKSASGSAQKHRTLRSAKRGKECDPKTSRSSSHAPDRHPKGQDYRLGSHSD